MAEPKLNTSTEQDIFQKKVLPIMERVQKELRQKQLEEYGFLIPYKIKQMTFCPSLVRHVPIKFFIY